jgi:drug/metabolite transporter (DMT)-like permease
LDLLVFGYLFSPRPIPGLQNSIWREFAVLGASLSFSILLILINKLLDISPIATSRNILIEASVYMVPASLLIDQPWNIHTSTLSLCSLLMLGTMCGGICICNVCHTYCACRSYIHITQQLFLVPVIGTMIGIGFLGEKLTWSALVLMNIAMISNELGENKQAKSV